MLKVGDKVKYITSNKKGVIKDRHGILYSYFLVQWNGPFEDPVGEWNPSHHLVKITTRKLRVRLP